MQTTFDKKRDMLNLSFLKTTLSALPGITNPETQLIESAAGYDGIVEILNQRSEGLVIVLEHNAIGQLQCLPGGFIRSSQSLWVMDTVGFNENRLQHQQRMFSMLKDIVKTFNRTGNVQELSGWNSDSISYGIRNAGTNMTGYEAVFYFDEDIDLA